MILFLYGKDTYRLQQKLKEIEAQYKKVHKSGLNLEKIEVEQIDFREFWNKLFQQSMFIEKKLFFLTGLFSNQRFKEDFFKKIKAIADSGDIVVVYEKGVVSKTDRLFCELKKYAESQEFEVLSGQKLRDWLKREVTKWGAEIEEKALDKLIGFVGSELWQMDNEIKKLTAYTKSIREKDVEFLVKPKIEVVIFETIDALAQQDKRKALRLLHKHFEKGDSPFYLLKMINFQFRNLLMLKSSEPKSGFDSYYATHTAANNLSKRLGMHPFVIKKAMGVVGKFSLEELKKIYQKIFETDLAIKTGRIHPVEGLRMLIAEI